MEPKNRNHLTIVQMNDIQPDPIVADLVKQALAPYKNELAEVVGETATALNRVTTLESTMDNFMLQALMESTGAQLAFSNGWRYGAPIVPGQITLNDLYNIIPMNPPVSTVEITGAELMEMLEENLERTFSCDPYNHMGGYVKRCLGLNVYFKIEPPLASEFKNYLLVMKRFRLTDITQQHSSSCRGCLQNMAVIAKISQRES